MRGRVDTLREWLVLYRVLAASSLRAKMVYRWNFVVSVLCQMVMYLADLAGVLVILRQVGTIGGWDAWDIVFLYGLVTSSAGVYLIFGAELHDFDKYLVNGEFDSVLTRPAPTVLTIAARSVGIEQAGACLQGIAVVAFASARLGPELGWGWARYGEVAVAMATGAAIWFSMLVATATLGFWTTRIDDLQPVFLYGLQTAAEYPLGIYPKAVRAIFYSVLPVAFGSYVPASVLLGKGFGQLHLAASVAVAAACLVGSTAFWNVGVRHYASTGSAA